MSTTPVDKDKDATAAELLRRAAEDRAAQARQEKARGGAR